MNFTIWALMAAFASGQGFFLAAVLFTKKDNRTPNRIIAILLLILALTLLEKMLWWTDQIDALPIIKGIGFGFPLLFGPMMFLFYQTTFEQKKPGLKTLGISFRSGQRCSSCCPFISDFTNPFRLHSDGYLLWPITLGSLYFSSLK